VTGPLVDIHVDLRGLDRLQDALESQPKNVAKRVIRNSLRTAVRPWREEMGGRVAKGWHVFRNALSKGKGRTREFGFISTHIGIKSRVNADELSGSASVGPVKKGFWSLFLEFGTSKSRPRPFIRASYEARKQDVLEAYTEQVRAQLKDLGLR
jgi:HK97 gp10 family phage protein